MKRITSVLTLLLCFTFASQAKVVLPAVIGDNMVLQQKSDAALWGKAEPGSKVVITTTWSKAKVTVTADADGKWSARVATPEAGGPYDITFNDGEKLVVKNVLVGEVWVCSGQSNMEMPMKGFAAQPVEGATELIVKAKPSTQIRVCTVERAKSLKPEYDCKAEWREHTPEAVAGASATAYFFGKMLNDVLGIPVGLLITDWGGTPIEAWMEKPLIEKEFAGEFNLDFYAQGKLPEKAQYKPGVLYNAMLSPIIPYTAKGFIWYQGCANRHKFEQYKRLQPAFVKMLREKWGNEDMPFYFTQIAPYKYKDPNAREAAYMMWAQAQTLKLIPKSGMATTLDVGELDCIHPAKKKEVGDRLAYLALVNDYGMMKFDAQGPIFKSVEYKDGIARVTFDVSPLGVGPISKNLPGFELAGKDKVFYPATGRVAKDKRTVKVSCPEVPEPVAVRYGMHNWSEATLFNNFGIPVSPFRTDDWE